MNYFRKIFFLLGILLIPYYSLGVNQAGIFSSIRDRTDKAYLDSLIYVADTTRYDTVKAINYLKISVALNIDASKKYKGKSGLEYFNKAKAIAFRLNKKQNFIQTIDNIGVRNRRNGHFKTALQFHQAALSMIDSTTNQKLKSIILNNIGVVYRRIDDYQNALAYHMKALTIADSLNDSRTKAMAINSLGNVYLALKKNNEALKFFKQSLSLEYELHNKLGIAINLNNIGSAYQALGKLNKAFEYFNLSLDINKELKSLKGIGICHNDIGNIYYHKKKYEEALNQYAISKNIFSQTGDQLYLANTFLAIGKVFYAKNKPEKAESNLKHALDIALKIGSKIVSQEAGRWLALTYKKEHNYEKALKYFELSNSLQDSINNITIQKNIIRMQIKYDLESKENEIALLHQQQKISSLELKKQKTANLLMLASIILFLLIIVFLFYYTHSRNQKNKLLEEKNSEIEAARNKLKKYSDDLLISKQEAEKSNRAKTEFLANISHEFRTPLNSIIGFADILYSAETDADKKEKLSIIKSSSESLLLLLNDILDLSKIEAGKININYAPVNIYKTIKEIYRLFLIKTEEKNIHFTYSIQDNFPKYIIFSEIRLRQILFNLIGNAVKFTTKGEISIEAYFDETVNSEKIDFIIKIKDTGIGINKEDIDKIFHPFVQLNQKTEHQGTGLGLTITKRLVESMGGSISIESEIDKGTCFKLRFNSIKITSSISASDSENKQATVTEKSNVKTLFFTNDGYDSSGIFEFLNRVTKPVIKVENDLTAAKEAIKDVDLAILCGSNDTKLNNSYKVLSQTLGSDKLWFVLLSEAPQSFKLMPTPIHFVINKSLKELSKLWNSLLSDINEQKELTRLSVCFNMITQNPELKLEFKNEVIPLFNIAMESKIMSNISKFSNSLKVIAEKYHLESMKEFITKLEKNIQNFNINEVERLLLFFGNNCKNNVEI